MKRVIFISNYFGNGGAARVMQTLMQSLSEKNCYEIKLYTFSDDDKRYKIPDGVEHINIKTKCKIKTLAKIERIYRLRKLLKEYNNSTIIAFEYFVNMQVIIANSFIKNKLIISERNDPKTLNNWKKILRDFLYKYADCLVCQTEDARNYFSEKIKNKTVVIPNAIKSDLPERYEGIRNKEIVTFCRIREKQKNLKMMIDAYKMLLNNYNDYKLIIYGDGNDKDILIEYCKKNGLEDKVNFYKFEKDIHSKIIKSAMYVISSNYEGISNSMIEAMGIGLPTIATDCPCGGAKMMIENNVNGILIPVGDTKALYEAMKKIIDNPEFAEKLSKNSTKIKEKLNKDKINEKWIKLI